MGEPKPMDREEKDAFTARAAIMFFKILDWARSGSIEAQEVLRILNLFSFNEHQRMTKEQLKKEEEPKHFMELFRERALLTIKGALDKTAGARSSDSSEFPNNHEMLEKFKKKAAKAVTLNEWVEAMATCLLQPIGYALFDSYECRLCVMESGDTPNRSGYNNVFAAIDTLLSELAEAICAPDTPFFMPLDNHLSENGTPSHWIFQSDGMQRLHVLRKDENRSALRLFWTMTPGWRDSSGKITKPAKVIAW